MRAGLVVCAVVLLPAPAAFGQGDHVYFPAVDNVTNVLVSKIRAETVRIDMSAWYLSEHAISLALVDARRRGVNVRLLGDRGAIFEIDVRTRDEFYWLASQGVPIRLRFNPTWFPEIVHWKATIFKGQGLVAFGSANYTPSQLAPSSSSNYSDETVLLTTDPAIVGAFLTKFDVMWNDTTAEPGSQVSPPYLRNWNQACAAESACGDYATRYPNPAPMTISTARLEPNNPMPADLVWSQGAAFNNRLIQEINAESSAVKFVIYRLTVDTITDALLAKFRSGVPVQLIIEPQEYLNEKWPEFWLTHANIDKLWAAGVPIRQRTHEGLTHMKMLVTSRFATNASSNLAANWQRDTNYFVPAGGKPAVYQAMVNRFDTMWNDTAGHANFVPRPPRAPVLASPAAGATGVSQTPRLTWEAAPFATSYDVYLGTSVDSMFPVANVAARLVNTPPTTYSWTASSSLSGGTTYYWKVVARTNATVRDPSIVAASATRVFVTTGTRPANGGTIGGDFDGDGDTDLTIYRRSSGQWYVRGVMTAALGTGEDVPVPADYDGDGRLDVAVWRAGSGTWEIVLSTRGYSTTNPVAVQWGARSVRDVPVPADYDGDGRADLAVWRPGTGTWWILNSTSSYSASAYRAVQWGAGSEGDVPVPGDYDGDGRADLGIWRPTTGAWWLLTSSSGFNRGAPTVVQWGAGTQHDVPVPADYDGDGRMDLGVWRPAEGTWWILRSSAGYSRGSAAVYQWGSAAFGDIPVPGDYDADGRADPGIWRPVDGTWWALRSSANYGRSFPLVLQWGCASCGDVPATGTGTAGAAALKLLIDR